MDANQHESWQAKFEGSEVLGTSMGYHDDGAQRAILAGSISSGWDHSIVEPPSPKKQSVFTVFRRLRRIAPHNHRRFRSFFPPH